MGGSLCACSDKVKMSKFGTDENRNALQPIRFPKRRQMEPAAVQVSISREAKIRSQEQSYSTEQLDIPKENVKTGYSKYTQSARNCNNQGVILDNIMAKSQHIQTESPDPSPSESRKFQSGSLANETLQANRFLWSSESIQIYSGLIENNSTEIINKHNKSSKCRSSEKRLHFTQVADGSIKTKGHSHSEFIMYSSSGEKTTQSEPMEKQLKPIKRKAIFSKSMEFLSSHAFNIHTEYKGNETSLVSNTQSESTGLRFAKIKNNLSESMGHMSSLVNISESTGERSKDDINAHSKTKAHVSSIVDNTHSEFEKQRYSNAKNKNTHSECWGHISSVAINLHSKSNEQKISENINIQSKSRTRHRSVKTKNCFFNSMGHLSLVALNSPSEFTGHRFLKAKNTQSEPMKHRSLEAINLYSKSTRHRSSEDINTNPESKENIHLQDILTYSESTGQQSSYAKIINSETMEDKSMNIIDSIRYRSLKSKNSAFMKAEDEYTETDLALVKEEIEKFLKWVDRFDEHLKDDYLVEIEAGNIKQRLGKLEKLKYKLNKRKETLAIVQQKAQDMLYELHSTNHSDVEGLLITLKMRLRVMHNLMNERGLVLEAAADEWKNMLVKMMELSTGFKELMIAAENFEIIRLLATDVEKQLDACKSMFDKTHLQTEEIMVITGKAECLMCQCNHLGKKQMTAVIRELTKRHANLLLRLKQHNDNLWNSLCSRKKFEDDCHKIKRWCKETKSTCNKLQNTDLSECYRIFQKLYISGQVFHSLVTETLELGKTFWPSLHAADKINLKQQLHFLYFNFKRVFQHIEDQLKTREQAIKVQYESNVEIISSGDSQVKANDAVNELKFTPNLGIHSEEREQNPPKRVQQNLSTRKETLSTNKFAVQLLKNHILDTVVQVREMKQQTSEIESEAGFPTSSPGEISKKMEDFEKEMNELMRWVENTRTSMTMRDTTIDLCEQLSVQEHLLDDVLKCKDRFEQLLTQDPEAGQIQITQDSVHKTVSVEPTLTPAIHLQSEMALLETSVRDQLESLELAVSQQEMYENQILKLSQAIEDAQKKLQTSPVTATSVGALKQQIEDRNNLTEQIKNYQTKVSEISEKSRQLALDSAQLSPSVFRKHYHPESAYMDYFSATSQYKRSASPLLVSGNLFYDRLPEFNLPPPSELGFLTVSNGNSKDNLLSWIPFDHLNEVSNLNSITIELPRKIPPPRTDSIPRPTWSGDIISTSVSSSDMSKGISTSHSLESPRSSVMVLETVAHHNKSHCPDYTSTNQFGEPIMSTVETLTGTQISRSTDPCFTSCDSGLGTDVNDLSPIIFQFPTESSSLIWSKANKLASASEQSPKRAPVGGVPTEILRMRHISDQNEFPHSCPDDDVFNQNDITFMDLLKTSADNSQDNYHIKSALSTNNKQRNVQTNLQNLAETLERLEIRIAVCPTSETSSSLVAMTEALAECKEIFLEIESVKNDLAHARDVGQELQDLSDLGDIGQIEDVKCKSGYRTVDDMLAVLCDKCHTLEVVANNKSMELENSIHEKEKQAIIMNGYSKQIKDIQIWLQENEAHEDSYIVLTDNVNKLQDQLNGNNVVQEQINKYLGQVAEMVLQCDIVSMADDTTYSEKVTNDLSELQTGLKELQAVFVKQQSHLQAAIREISEKSMFDEVFPFEQINLHKELAKDIREHKQLVSQIANQVKQYSTSSAEVITSDNGIKDDWEKLSRNMAQRKENLEGNLKTNNPKEMVKISFNATTKFADFCRQLEDVRNDVVSFTESCDKINLHRYEDHLQPEKKQIFHQKYQSVLRNVSNWLDVAELQLFTHPLTTEEQVIQNENLKIQIKAIQKEVTIMNERADFVLASTDSNNRDLIKASISSMNERVQLIESTAHSQTEQLQQANRQWKQYECDVSNLKKRLQDTQDLIMAPTSTLSLKEISSNNENIESELKACETCLIELKKIESKLTQRYPRGVFSSGLAAFQSKYLELQRKVLEKKSTHEGQVLVQNRYYKMLNDCAAFLEIAQERLQVDSISAKNLNDLKQQLANFKDFFNDIEVQRAMLDSLTIYCDPTTRFDSQQQHSVLVNLIKVLVDQASLYGKRLERLTNQWGELESKHSDIHKELTSLEFQLPQAIINGESMNTIQEKISKYKWLKQELENKKDAVFDVVEKGTQILHSINCPALESAITDLAEMWVTMNTSLTHELKKAETLGDQLSVFETEMTILSSWLITAKMKLASFMHLPPLALNNIAAVRAEVDKIVEFHKELDYKLSLKNKVLTVGNQLMQNKNYDTRGLSTRLRDYEAEWAQLEKGILETKEYLFKIQMQLMPSRQTLSELTIWIDQICNSLEKEAAIITTEGGDVQDLVRKYKGYKIELASKQMLLNFVNQQVLAPQPDDVDEEKLEFAEKLEALNKQWSSLIKEVNDRLKVLDGANNKWTEFHDMVKGFQSWSKEIEEKMMRYQLIGNGAGVRQTQREFQALQQQLLEKQADLTSLKVLGNHLYEVNRDSLNTQQTIKDSLSNLDDSQKRLEERAGHLQSLLSDMTNYWTQYHSSLSDLNLKVTHADYALSQYSTIRGDIQTLQSQLLKLRNLRDELNTNSGSLESFSALASQLRQVCEPHVQLEIQKIVSELQAKWRQLDTDLGSRCSLFQKVLDEWQLYENQFSKVQEWVDTRTSICNDHFDVNTDAYIRPQVLEKCKQLQKEFDNFQSEVSNLYIMGEKLMKNMDLSSSSILVSRHSVIEQKIVGLRHKLSQLSDMLSNDILMVNKFIDAFETVKKFLNYCDDILLCEDPTKSAEDKDIQFRLAELKNLLVLFTTNLIKLDTLNDLGYHLALEDMDVRRLIELNHKWYQLYEDAKDRSRTLQDIAIHQEDFTSKCDLWINFLAQAEKNLAENIKVNLHDLTCQLCKYEQFESDMYIQQQILHSIINDSQKMMMTERAEDKDEVQRKLGLITQQWQSVSKNVSQRKAVIEDMIHQWQQFNSLSQDFKHWLKYKNAVIDSFEPGSTSLLVTRNLVKKIEAVQCEFKLQENTFKKVQDIGHALLQHADDVAAKNIQNTLSEIKTEWFKLLQTLDNSKSQLKRVDQKVLDCENDIDDMMGKIKDIRKSLNDEIPTTYDALESDMKRCKDIGNDLLLSDAKQQHLLEKDSELGRLVPINDMNLLRHRMHLLNKQKDELWNQTHIREEKITDTLFRWTYFADCWKSLMDWVEDMTIKVVSNKNLHVEDFLAKLENEYEQELEEKEIERSVIVEQGIQLVGVSSEQRASDIRQKLHRLQEKWQHLNGVIDFRQRKLKETVLAMKQLDISMKNLSKWLSTVEIELHGGITFKDSGLKEVLAQLQESQELHKDIISHSAGVSAVINLCEVLLHDSDACPTETEFATLQHAMKILETRWHKICAISLNSQTRVEETWQLRDSFQDDCKRFSEWMKRIEQEVKDSEIEVSNVKAAKKSFKKYEDLQRNIHDHLSDLEQINRQYCQLAKIGCTDKDCSRKAMLTELNNSWDELQLRVTEIVKKLRHSSSIREDFETTHASLMTWLTEVDRELAVLQHSTDLDLQSKVNEIQRFEDEIHTKRYRMKYFDQAGIYLMQKGDSQEALKIQKKLDEFRTFCKKVLEQVIMTQLQIEHMVVAKIDDNTTIYKSEDRCHQLAANSASQLYNNLTLAEQQIAGLEKCFTEPPLESSHFLHKLDISRSQRSLSPGKRTPSATDKSRSPRQRSKSPSRMRSRSPNQKLVKIIRSGSPQKMFSTGQKSLTRLASDGVSDYGQHRLDIVSLEKSAKVDVIMEQLVESLDNCNIKLARLDQSFGPYGDAINIMQSWIESVAIVDEVQKLNDLLKIETGLTDIDSVDVQVKFVLRRFEILQQKLKVHDVSRCSHDSHDIVQFVNDLDSVLTWLSETEALQSKHLYLPSDLHHLDLMAKKYQNFLHQLETKKPVVLVINLLKDKYLKSKSAKAKQLEEKLYEMNTRWDLVLAWADSIKRELWLSLEQSYLLHILDDYHLWLERIEAKVRDCEPTTLTNDEAFLEEKYSRLMELQTDIKNNQANVQSLKEMTDWLLVSTEASKVSIVQDKIFIVHQRMQSLIHLTSAFIDSLEYRLETASKKGIAMDSFNASEKSSGLGSSHQSRSPTPTQYGVHPARTRSRSPFTTSQLFKYRT